MGLDDAPDDGESEPRSHRPRREEGVECAADHIAFHSAPRVGDFDADHGYPPESLGAGAHANEPLPRRSDWVVTLPGALGFVHNRLTRVFQQILEHRGHQSRIHIEDEVFDALRDMVPGEEVAECELACDILIKHEHMIKYTNDVNWVDAQVEQALLTALDEGWLIIDDSDEEMSEVYVRTETCERAV